MNNINLEPNKDTPRVLLDNDNGLIEFEGNSYPGDAYEFYTPLLAWLKEYFDGNAQESTTVNIKLGYFNSATSQILYDMLDLLKDAMSNSLIVNWHYNSENEDSFEDYEDMAEEFPELNLNPIPYTT